MIQILPDKIILFQVEKKVTTLRYALRLEYLKLWYKDKVNFKEIVYEGDDDDGGLAKIKHWLLKL